MYFLFFTYQLFCDIICRNMKGIDEIEDIKRNFRVFDVSCNVLACMCLFHGKRSVHI